MDRERRGLGRGLSALMADVGAADGPEGQPRARAEQLVPIEQITPNPEQPRRRFDDEDLTELANSIREKGIIQPLIVRPTPGAATPYQIVAGERRWRAAQLAQRHDLPVIVRDFTDIEVLEVAIIENVQRADLNPIEEARAYRQLMDRFGHTQEKVAEALGKSRSHIANLLRLLHLPDDILAHLADGRLSAGHGRALITADDPSGLARKVLEKGLSVRETERLAKSAASPAAPRAAAAKSAEKDADTRVLEQDLSANLGMKVQVDHQPESGGGSVKISYKSLEQLDELCRLLSLTTAGGSI